MKKIVVAEGSPTIKSVADSLLRQCGYDVICTSDGLQAWEIIRSEKPDLVLSGLGLSGMNGLELCRQMAKDVSTGGIPFVLLLGAKDPIREDEINSAGIRGKIRKPFSPKDLLEVVNKLAGPSDLAFHKPDNASPAFANSSACNSEKISSTIINEKTAIPNVDWVDLANKTSTAYEKAASFDLSLDEQELVLEEDQYGLARPPEPEQLPKQAEKTFDEESYDWFIGEMKKEIENKAPGTSAIPPPRPQETPAATPSQPADRMKFDDIHSEGDLVNQTKARQAPSKFNPAPGFDVVDALNTLPGAAEEKQVSQPSASRNRFSDDEIVRIADQVSLKLAAHIVSLIDKKQLIEIIKSALKS